MSSYQYNPIIAKADIKKDAFRNIRIHPDDYRVLRFSGVINSLTTGASQWAVARHAKLLTCSLILCSVSLHRLARLVRDYNLSSPLLTLSIFPCVQIRLSPHPLSSFCMVLSIGVRKCHYVSYNHLSVH